ncbi:MAG: EamA family transporter [Sphingobacteriaceae bacterium]|nr:MAG: EamA family transporter [Sphingobacteriaceae bacterium]
MTTHQKPSAPLVIIAFALVYIVWGSTYFFIRMAIGGIPPFLMGAMRFCIAGLLMLAWCIARGEKIWLMKHNIHSAISGVMMLFGGTGAVIWAERNMPSAVVAILVAASPVWFVLLDVRHWRDNFKNISAIIGLIVGFAGVILLFGEQLTGTLGKNTASKLPDMAIIVAGSMLWSAGSLYSKYKATDGTATVNTTWQMLAAGIAFIFCSFLHNEFEGFDPATIPASAWYAVGYLVVFGSIVAFSAYIWLLQVRPITQVSTYAYVNPVIALLLGVLFAGENISWLQVGGLVIILSSVLLINLPNYRKAKQGG